MAYKSQTTMDGSSDTFSISFVVDSNLANSVFPFAGSKCVPPFFSVLTHSLILI